MRLPRQTIWLNYPSSVRFSLPATKPVPVICKLALRFNLSPARRKSIREMTINWVIRWIRAARVMYWEFGCGYSGGDGEKNGNALNEHQRGRKKYYRICFDWIEGASFRCCYAVSLQIWFSIWWINHSRAKRKFECQSRTDDLASLINHPHHHHHDETESVETDTYRRTSPKDKTHATRYRSSTWSVLSIFNKYQLDPENRNRHVIAGIASRGRHCEQWWGHHQSDRGLCGSILQAIKTLTVGGSGVFSARLGHFSPPRRRGPVRPPLGWQCGK